MNHLYRHRVSLATQYVIKKRRKTRVRIILEKVTAQQEMPRPPRLGYHDSLNAILANILRKIFSILAVGS